MLFPASSARFGFMATVPANVGYHIATWIVTAAIGLGFVTALDRFPQAFLAVEIAGSFYVFWIAWKLFRAGAVDGYDDAKAATFLDGVILLILNPKTYFIIALMFTQFLTTSQHGRLAAVVLITTVFTINNLIAFSIWALVGYQIAGYFRTPEAARKLNMMFGGILAAVAIWMLLFYGETQGELMTTRFNPPTGWPQLGRAFNHDVVEPEGKRLHSTGQVSWDGAGTLTGARNREAQIRQCFDSVEHNLKAVGGRL